MSAELVDPFAPPPRKRYLAGTEALCEQCKSGEESSEHYYECVLPGAQRERDEVQRNAALPLEEGEFQRIANAFYDRPWEDPTRYQDGFATLLGVVGAIAVGGGSGEWASHEATQALRRLMARVLHGEEQAEVNRHG
jgi:hypothetical protein